MPVGEAVAQEAGDDVDVRVENDLACGGVVVHLNVDSVGIERSFYRSREFFDHYHKVREGFIWRLVEIRVVLFGDHQRVANVDRMNV